MSNTIELISFDFSAEPFLAGMKSMALSQDDQALLAAVTSLEAAMTGYFREPPLSTINDLMKALHEAASAFSNATQQAPDEPLSPEFFIRMRTIAIETHRPPPFGRTLQ